MKKNRYPGFSLIEVLIALAIASIIGVALFTTLTQMNSLTQNADTIMYEDGRITLLHNQLKKDLSGAFVPTQAVEQPLDKEKKNKKPLQKIFYGTNQEKGMLNTLTFITTNPLASYGSSKPRVARIMYRLIAEKESGNPPTYTLYRQQGNDLEYDSYKQDNKKNRSYMLAEDIKSVTIDYATYKKQEKKTGAPEVVEIVKEWDSDKLDVKDKEETPAKKEEKAPNDKSQSAEKKEKKERTWLPLYAKITITLWDQHKKHEQTTQLIVPIAGSSFTEPIQEPAKPSEKKPKDSGGTASNGGGRA